LDYQRCFCQRDCCFRKRHHVSTFSIDETFHTFYDIIFTMKELPRNKSMSISEHIDSKYREYALYVLQSRGIPNFYDSLTPVQRIVLQNSPAQFNKTIGLVGEVIRTGLYHHGDMSLAGAIAKLARPFGCSHQIMEGDGFFGSPVNPAPSAARYTSVRINSDIKSIISRHSDLNEKNEEGGVDWLNLEVPIGLATHIIGIAVGYRTNILPRKMEDITEYLDGKNKLLKPHFKDFGGRVVKIEGTEDTWLIESGFEPDEKKKTVRIFDLPPVTRYDGFMVKLYQKLDFLGYDYRVNNASQSSCDLTVVFSKVTPSEFTIAREALRRISQIVVKEDIVFVRDGGVCQYNSVKEYLDDFKIHLEYVRLKRLVRDEQDYTSELEYLEAKLKFLIFMSQKKRIAKEIEEFLSQFTSKISNRLSSIQIIKLSAEHIEETKKEIERIKSLIKETRKKIQIQKKIAGSMSKPKRSKQLVQTSSAPRVNKNLEGIEIFEVLEEEDETQEIDED
jgi:DNA gyrase/topoisomerase IV subunit A